MSSIEAARQAVAQAVVAHLTTAPGTTNARRYTVLRTAALVTTRILLAGDLRRCFRERQLGTALPALHLDVRVQVAHAALGGRAAKCRVARIARGALLAGTGSYPARAKAPGAFVNR